MNGSVRELLRRSDAETLDSTEDVVGSMLGVAVHEVYAMVADATDGPMLAVDVAMHGALGAANR
jgi:hypothetical protein